jgi:hypothetical protein
MKEHLLAIVFLGLLFLLYVTPMPETFLKINLEQKEQEDKEIENYPQQRPQSLPESQSDSIQISVVAATRL